MIKNYPLLAILVLLCSACVDSKVHEELDAKYVALKEKHNTLLSTLTTIESELNQLKDSQIAYDTLQASYLALKPSYNNLKASYEALEKNSSEAIKANLAENRELLNLLEDKEQALATENIRLEKLKTELQDRSKRITELENVIAAKDAAMTTLKNAISKALTDFEGKGLTVEQRDGKVYISMENKLLFNSGSWAVGPEGNRAVKQLGNVLAKNPDIAVLIEGHTDNVPYQGNEQLSGNWDLSTKRATAIVNILRENADISPENLTAAGRGEYAPIATNTTPEGKAKNRRIEVVLTPKLDELSKLLNEN